MEKYIAAVSSVLDTEKKIEAKVREMHRQCGRFVGLLALVHEGRAEEALRVDLEKLELRGSSDSTA